MSVKAIHETVRKIIHVDMDAFYASVEQRDNPSLKGLPVIVGGSPDSRGVVTTCSYEARKYGIHSAMPSSHAYRLCPEAIFIYPRFQVYKQISFQIREIFTRYTDLVEPLSLDEAFLDVTVNKQHIPSATHIAKNVLREIYEETGLTASAGVSINKFVAKVASDIRKPAGLTVIPPNKVQAFIEQLPIRKFFGIGKVTEQKMKNLGIHTGADLKKIDKASLIKYFGKSGNFYFYIARGIDNRPVNPHRERKSLGCETTLQHDTTNMQEILDILQNCAEKIEHQMFSQKLKGRTLTLKVKYHDFKQVTRSQSLEQPFNNSKTIISLIPDLLKKTDVEKKPVRLLGISISNFKKHTESEPPISFPFIDS